MFEACTPKAALRPASLLPLFYHGIAASLQSPELLGSPCHEPAPTQILQHCRVGAAQSRHECSVQFPFSSTSVWADVGIPPPPPPCFCFCLLPSPPHLLFLRIVPQASGFPLNTLGFLGFPLNTLSVLHFPFSFRVLGLVWFGLQNDMCKNVFLFS